MKKGTVLIGLPVWLLLVGLMLAADQPVHVTPDAAIHRLVSRQLAFLTGKERPPQRQFRPRCRDRHQRATSVCHHSLLFRFARAPGDRVRSGDWGHLRGPSCRKCLRRQRDGVDRVCRGTRRNNSRARFGAHRVWCSQGGCQQGGHAWQHQVADRQNWACRLQGPVGAPGSARDRPGTAATEANVWHSIEELFKHSPTTRHYVQSGKLKVFAAVYDVKSGRVRWLGEHPLQNKLLVGSRKQQPNGR